jgi:carboxymethylenebutenolidase
MRRLTRDAVLRDTGALIRWIDEHEIAAGRMGTIGFCMGGRMALWAAAEFNDRVAAAVSLHGGQLGTASPDSPHRFADRLQSELYLGFASDDDLVPQEHIDTLLAALDAANVRYEVETHPGTQHGYTFPERHCYNHDAAERSWSRVLSLFARRLT